jgi:cysteine-rich repeat protein
MNLIRRSNLRWLLAPSLALVGGCSTLVIHESDCTDDAQCEDAFGAGFTCGAGGTCEPAPECVDDLCPAELAQECGTPDVPVVESSSDFVLVNTEGLGNHFDELSCLADQPQGDEGFFAIDVVAGERWHFHVRVTDDFSNPAVYVLPQCDERSCQTGDGLDACGPGSDEHLSFVAPEAGRYIVGVDTRAPGGAAFELLALRPICGNGGMPEHSESCDDGNTSPLDGCDDRCRAELRAAAPQEVEPNDDRVAANVVLLDQDTMSLVAHATMGGRCDFDNFLVTVDEGSTLSAVVGAASADACDASAPPVTLQLRAPDGVTVLGQGTAQGDNACPSFGPGDAFASGLQAGDYIVRVFTGQAEAAFEYSLDVSVSPPA